MKIVASKVERLFGKLIANELVERTVYGRSLGRVAYD